MQLTIKDLEKYRDSEGRLQLQGANLRGADLYRAKYSWTR